MFTRAVRFEAGKEAPNYGALLVIAAIVLALAASEIVITLRIRKR